MAPLERAMVVSYIYKLSIVAVALSVTIRPQFAIECLRRSNQQGGGEVGPFGPHLRVFPLEQTRHVGVAKSEHPRLTNGEIPTYVITIHQRHRRTDRQTTCDRNTALCTKVHRAVKIKRQSRSSYQQAKHGCSLYRLSIANKVLSGQRFENSGLIKLSFKNQATSRVSGKLI